MMDITYPITWIYSRSNGKEGLTTLLRFPNIPRSPYDFLAPMEMGQVTNFTYSSCFKSARTQLDFVVCFYFCIISTFLNKWSVMTCQSHGWWSEFQSKPARTSNSSRQAILGGAGHWRHCGNVPSRHAQVQGDGGGPCCACFSCFCIDGCLVASEIGFNKEKSLHFWPGKATIFQTL